MTNVGIVLQHFRAIRHVVEEPVEFSGDVIYSEPIGQQLLDDFTIGNEIDQRDIFHLDDMIESETDEMRNGRLITHHLGNIQQCRLERVTSAAAECERSAYV